MTTQTKGKSYKTLTLSTHLIAMVERELAKQFINTGRKQPLNGLIDYLLQIWIESKWDMEIVREQVKRGMK